VSLALSAALSMLFLIFSVVSAMMVLLQTTDCEGGVRLTGPAVNRCLPQVRQGRTPYPNGVAILLAASVMPSSRGDVADPRAIRHASCHDLPSRLFTTATVSDGALSTGNH